MPTSVQSWSSLVVLVASGCMLACPQQHTRLSKLQPHCRILAKNWPALAGARTPAPSRPPSRLAGVRSAATEALLHRRLRTLRAPAACRCVLPAPRGSSWPAGGPCACSCPRRWRRLLVSGRVPRHPPSASAWPEGGDRTGDTGGCLTELTAAERRRLARSQSRLRLRASAQPPGIRAPADSEPPRAER